ncbi:SRPBCC family protein [Gordonia sp. PKS22-38]|uniref:SRPBCC family protein n=1 Tax=Gordonia prachuapensis TaxID=3115651 RepID=A0ABU7MU31_9ACTN|nr:SRPBCC family protein [Gordonia sp. PKS22-38]
MRTRAAIVVGGLASAAAAVVYQWFLRRLILTWGATPDEVSAALRGDELLPGADGVSTRAITVAAQPQQVYPWLVQMGPDPRGGAYTYDWVENLLGLHMHSSDVVLDAFQHPTIGTEVDLGPNRMIIEIANPGEAFAIRSADGNWVWAFTIVDRADGTCRLISRNRYRLPRLRDRIGMLPMEAGSLIMERKMLLGIRHRAEHMHDGAAVRRLR